jgi:hypothetical protein
VRKLNPLPGDILTNDPATTTQSTVAPPEGVKPSPWILNPILDYLFVAGGAVWLAVLANQLLLGNELPFDKTDPRKIGLLTVIIVSQHLFFNAHNVATYFRLWGSESDQQAFKFYRTKLLYAAIALYVLAILMQQLIGVLVTVYLVTTFWHWAMQTFGIALVYCEKRGYTVSRFEKASFRALMIMLSLLAGVRFFTDETYSPYTLYGAATPFWMAPSGSMAAQAVLHVSLVLFCISAAVFLIAVVRKLFVDKKFIPAPVLLMLATIGALGLTSKPINVLLWIYIPALYHGSQYMALNLSYSLHERGLVEPTARTITKQLRDWPAINWIGKAVLVGCAVYVILPHVVSLVNLTGYDEALGLTLAVVNFHQFATDAAIWHLGNGRIRKNLVA